MKNLEKNVLKNKQLLEKIKKEVVNLGILLVILLIAFKIIFYREDLIIIIKVLFALLYIIILPGYFIMIYWIDKISFIERIIIGIAAGTAVVGIISYFLGIIGLNVKYHVVPLPLFIIPISVILFKISKK